MPKLTYKYLVTGVAPGHSMLNGKTLNLGLCYSEREAQRCASFWHYHYDDITIQPIENEQNT